jgi:uncharacterized protein YndB with AHSA1/START domain
MDRAKPVYIYVTYIATTAEKLWAALTDGETQPKYWYGHRNITDWKVGSRWEQRVADAAGQLRLVGKVVEIDAPRRLVITWAFPADDQIEAKHSRVTFELEPVPDAVKLTVTHDRLEPDSEMLRGIVAGWPAVLSGLKTLLETGRPLSIATKPKVR